MPDDNCCYLCNECPQTFASLLELQSHLQQDHHTSNINSTTNAAISQQQEMSIEKSVAAPSTHNFANGKVEDGMEEVDNADDDEEMDMTLDESATHPGEDEHLCGGNSPTSSDFSVDENMNDSSNIGLMSGPAVGDGSYPCLKCTRMFSDRDQLNIHYTHTHRDKPQYVCEVCEKVFAVKRELSTHLRIHSGEQPHKCAQCGKEFGTRQLLKKHNMWHTGERSHVCDHCGKAFFQKGHLTQHLMIHKGGRPHQCSLCEKTFIFKFDLNRHMKIHAERGHSCPKCGKCFPKECALEEHVGKCKRTPSRSQTSRHPANSSPHSIISDGSPSSRHDAPSSSSSPRPAIRPQYSHPSASSLVTTVSNSQSPVTHYNTLQSSIKLEPSNVLPSNQPSTFFPTSTPNSLGMFSEEEVSKVAKVLFAQQQQALAAQNLANFFAANGLQKQPAMQTQSPFFGGSPAAAAQGQWNCFLCNKQMPNQAAYMMHWSAVHLRASNVDDVNNNNNIETKSNGMTASSPFLHPNKTSVDLQSDCYSATNSSCASSPQKISPVGPATTTSITHAQQPDQSAVRSTATNYSLCCANCENSRQRLLDAEKELANTRMEVDRLKQVLEKVGSIANSLFNSCGNTNNPELEKLWMLRAK
uniref:C2H2-type domain-containing protein n=1 Tax=Ditylenchus dipsaci TaxID=166011 RepID=A0A915CYV3_9BILA